MDTQFYVWDKVSFRYTGQYFSEVKKLENSTAIQPSSLFCEWDGSTWVNASAECPLEVALWKIRAVLKLRGLEDAVTTALTSLEEPTKTAGLYIWNYGAAVERNSQTTIYIQAVLQLTDAQVDDMFIQANALVL